MPRLTLAEKLRDSLGLNELIWPKVVFTLLLCVYILLVAVSPFMRGSEGMTLQWKIQLVIYFAGVCSCIPWIILIAVVVRLKRVRHLNQPRSIAEPIKVGMLANIWALNLVKNWLISDWLDPEFNEQRQLDAQAIFYPSIKKLDWESRDFQIIDQKTLEQPTVYSGLFRLGVVIEITGWQLGYWNLTIKEVETGTGVMSQRIFPMMDSQNIWVNDVGYGLCYNSIKLGDVVAVDPGEFGLALPAVTILHDPNENSFCKDLQSRQTSMGLYLILTGNVNNFTHNSIQSNGTFTIPLPKGVTSEDVQNPDHPFALTKQRLLLNVGCLSEQECVKPLQFAYFDEGQDVVREQFIRPQACLYPRKPFEFDNAAEVGNLSWDYLPSPAVEFTFKLAGVILFGMKAPLQKRWLFTFIFFAFGCVSTSLIPSSYVTSGMLSVAPATIPAEIVCHVLLITLNIMAMTERRLYCSSMCRLVRLENDLRGIHHLYLGDTKFHRVIASLNFVRDHLLLLSAQDTDADSKGLNAENVKTVEAIIQNIRSNIARDEEASNRKLTHGAKDFMLLLDHKNENDYDRHLLRKYETMTSFNADIDLDPFLLEKSLPTGIGILSFVTVSLGRPLLVEYKPKQRVTFFRLVEQTEYLYGNRPTPAGNKYHAAIVCTIVVILRNSIARDGIPEYEFMEEGEDSEAYDNIISLATMYAASAHCVGSFGRTDWGLYSELISDPFWEPFVGELGGCQVEGAKLAGISSLMNQSKTGFFGMFPCVVERNKIRRHIHQCLLDLSTVWTNEGVFSIEQSLHHAMEASSEPTGEAIHRLILMGAEHHELLQSEDLRSKWRLRMELESYAEEEYVRSRVTCEPRPCWPVCEPMLNAIITRLPLLMNMENFLKRRLHTSSVSKPVDLEKGVKKIWGKSLQEVVKDLETVFEENARTYQTALGEFIERRVSEDLWQQCPELRGNIRLDGPHLRKELENALKEKTLPWVLRHSKEVQTVPYNRNSWHPRANYLEMLVNAEDDGGKIGDQERKRLVSRSARRLRHEFKRAQTRLAKTEYDTD